MRTRLFFMFILTLVFVNSWAQDTVNQFDSNGKRHGVWKKYFDKTDQLRYEGQFFHGKEIDTFKFYRLNKKKSVLSAVKVFNPNNDMASVTFLSSKGKVISEGVMSGKQYSGKWTYYHNLSDNILTEEYYNEQGQLQGERKVYYENKQLAELANYKNGALHGISKWYSEDGTLLKFVHYINNELHGEAKYFDKSGVLLSEGVYQKDRKHGFWSYYKDGELFETVDHTRRSKNPKKQ